MIETFAPHVGTEFLAAGGIGDPLALRLSEVNAGTAQPNAPRVEPFSLVFTGPAAPILDQEIHRLEHDELGSLDIFLVPIGYDQAGSMRYEAVFN